jgi:hypothetical protein
MIAYYRIIIQYIVATSREEREERQIPAAGSLGSTGKDPTPGLAVCVCVVCVCARGGGLMAWLFFLL